MVVLQSVNLSTTGRYRCEVSAEAPSFQTVSDHGDMIVVGKFVCSTILTVKANEWMDSVVKVSDYIV